MSNTLATYADRSPLMRLLAQAQLTRFSPQLRRKAEQSQTQGACIK